MYEYNYLMHYGIPRKSGRYPWGSGERPYQGDSISTKKKHGLLSFRKNKQNKAEKAIQNLTKEQYEKEKEKALTRGTATEVLLFKNDLTTKQMQDAVNRINIERQLSNISRQERDDAWNSVNRAMKKVGDVKNWSSIVIELYNMIEKQMSKADKNSNKS